MCHAMKGPRFESDNHIHYIPPNFMTLLANTTLFDKSFKLLQYIHHTKDQKFFHCLQVKKVLKIYAYPSMETIMPWKDQNLNLTTTSTMTTPNLATNTTKHDRSFKLFRCVHYTRDLKFFHHWKMKKELRMCILQRKPSRLILQKLLYVMDVKCKS